MIAVWSHKDGNEDRPCLIVLILMRRQRHLELSIDFLSQRGVLMFETQGSTVSVTGFVALMPRYPPPCGVYSPAAK